MGHVHQRAPPPPLTRSTRTPVKPVTAAIPPEPPDRAHHHSAPPPAPEAAGDDRPAPPQPASLTRWWLDEPPMQIGKVHRRLAKHAPPSPDIQQPPATAAAAESRRSTTAVRQRHPGPAEVSGPAPPTAPSARSGRGQQQACPASSLMHRASPQPSIGWKGTRRAAATHQPRRLGPLKRPALTPHARG